jgi:hypothetical protein
MQGISRYGAEGAINVSFYKKVLVKAKDYIITIFTGITPIQVLEVTREFKILLIVI